MNFNGKGLLMDIHVQGGIRWLFGIIFQSLPPSISSQETAFLWSKSGEPNQEPSLFRALKQTSYLGCCFSFLHSIDGELLKQNVHRQVSHRDGDK